MKYIVYETTNKINGKKYRGAHCCSHGESCCYLGSGTVFKKALAKYGVEQFERKILEECESIDEMFAAEARYITPEWVENPSTYNMKIGGEGGWDYINKNGKRWTEEKRRLHSIELKKQKQLGTNKWKPTNPATCGFLGKHHTNEARKNISKNNAMLLEKDEIENRIAQMKEVQYPKRGSIQKLSKLWNVSHTQVSRFIRNHFTGSSSSG